MGATAAVRDIDAIEEPKGKPPERAQCKSRSNNPSLKRPISLAAPEQNCGS
jgi:hypothetical protein